MCIGGYGHRRIGTSAPVRGGVQNEAPVLKDRTKRHRSSRGPIVAIGVSFVVVDGVAGKK